MKPLMIAGLGLMLTAASVAAQTPAPQTAPRSTAKATAKVEDRDATVSELVVTGETPVPKVGEGAPLFAREELESAKTKAFRVATDARDDAKACGSTPDSGDFGSLFFEQEEAARRLVDLADRSAAASGAASAARAKAFASPTADNQKASEAAELARQQVVNEFLKAKEDLAQIDEAITDYKELVDSSGAKDSTSSGDISKETMRQLMFARRSTRKIEGGTQGIVLNKDVLDLTLSDIKAVAMKDKKGPYLQVSGLVGNPRDKPVPVPPLTLVAQDSAGFKLSSFTADPEGKAIIPPKSRFGFSYDYRPQPKQTKAVLVTFARPATRGIQKPTRYYCGG